MKKVTKFNYRKYYKEYYGIEFGDDMEVHHIDWYRNNNDIKNLLLIPSEVHSCFHLTAKFVKDFLNRYGNPKKLDFADGHTYTLEMFYKYISCVSEMEIWSGYKYLDYKYCNDSRITLLNK